MIKFFRRIRQNLLMENKTNKYLKYAIGEIILVVIGILIALQINNWNEQRKEQKNARTFAKNLADDLRQDIEMIEFRIQQISERIIKVDSISEFFRFKKISEVDNLDVIYQINYSYGYRPYTWFKSTIEEIKNSGGLKIIKNDSLRSSIINYYANANHMDEDFKGDEIVANYLNQSRNKITNINYPNREEFFDSLRYYWKHGIKEWQASQTYQDATNLNFKLLTQDINDIHVFTNNLFRYKALLNTRSVSELPRLISNAQKIIDLIETEYNND